MGVKKSMRHISGTNLATTIIIAVIAMQKRKVNLNLLMTLGISSKKVIFSTSFAVAPHDISMLNM